MKNLNYLLVSVAQTLLRVFPFPCNTGLVKIGNPGRNAPVLLTGNFRLTVERVRRALEGIDLMGSTPIYKSGLHEDRLLRIEFDPEQCRGAGFCERVCPRNVFEVDHDRRLASLPGAGQCVQCGACIVQCPFDALHFRGPKGDVAAPDTIRRFKLNLLGNRKVIARRVETEQG
jgi:ferredoxin